MILDYGTHRPRIAATAFVAPSADVIGRVRLGEHASIWYQCVLRGDVNRIDIGACTNIQDGSILHVDSGKPCVIEHHVHVGHHVNLHGCHVETGTLIGIGSIVLSGSRIGRGSVVGAGSVVLEGTTVPPGVLVVGVPARVVRKVTKHDQLYIRWWIEKYMKLAKAHRRAVERKKS